MLLPLKVKLFVKLIVRLVVLVTTPPTELHAVRTAIEEAGYKVASSDLTMIPTTVVELTQESQAKTVLRLMDTLEDHDDVEALRHEMPR